MSKRGAGGQQEVQNEVQVGLGGDSGAKAVSEGCVVALGSGFGSI